MILFIIQWKLLKKQNENDIKQIELRTRAEFTNFNKLDVNHLSKSNYKIGSKKIEKY